MPHLINIECNFDDEIISFSISIMRIPKITKKLKKIVLCIEIYINRALWKGFILLVNKSIASLPLAYPEITSCYSEIKFFHPSYSSFFYKLINYEIVRITFWWCKQSVFNGFLTTKLLVMQMKNYLITSSNERKLRRYTATIQICSLCNSSDNASNNSKNVLK